MSGLVWRKPFRSIEALREALEDYGLWVTEQRVQHYGEQTGAEAQEVPVNAPPGKAERVMQQNAEIDLRMEQLHVRAWHWYKILDAYYRFGLSVQNMGWIVAAEHCGLHCDPHSKHDSDRVTFFDELETAIRKLWHTRVY